MRKKVIKKKEKIMIPMFAPVCHVDKCIEKIRICLERGWTEQGFKTLEFE